jgi:hypothetical protein
MVLQTTKKIKNLKNGLNPPKKIKNLKNGLNPHR